MERQEATSPQPSPPIHTLPCDYHPRFNLFLTNNVGSEVPWSSVGSCRYYRPVDQRAAGAGVFISGSGLPGPALTERCSACEVQKKDKEKK